MLKHGDEGMTDGRFKMMADGLRRDVQNELETFQEDIRQDMAELRQAMVGITARMDELLRGNGGNSVNRNGGNGGNRNGGNRGDVVANNNDNIPVDDDQPEQVDNNMRQIKMKLPSFSGSVDADVYLEWESKLEHIFACNNYSEEKKCRLAQLEFTGYAMVWLKQTNFMRGKNGARAISTWQHLKEEMRRRFVPHSYYREQYRRLQTIQQGERSVDEYYQELVTLLAKAQVDEDEEMTMQRFLTGLRLDIAER